MTATNPTDNKSWSETATWVGVDLASAEGDKDGIVVIPAKISTETSATTGEPDTNLIPEPSKTVEPQKNRHLRRANKSKRAIKKAKAALAKQFKGLDLSKISGKIIIDGIEIQGEAKPPEETKDEVQSEAVPPVADAQDVGTGIPDNIQPL